MNLRDIIKKIWFSLYDSGRIVLLDYKMIPKRLYDEEKNKPHKGLYDIISENRESYKEILVKTLKYKSIFSSIKEEKDLSDKNEPGWNNGHLPGLDIVILYSLVAELKPSKYVEIGGGTSTKIAYKAKKDNSLSTEIILIDPAPRKEVAHLADEYYKKEIQKVNPNVFSSLTENDIVFFDGTHTLFPNSDVMWFFLEILPNLQKGVIVHIHDVYLPYDYPDFMCARYYSEQYLLGALLLNNSSKYEIICPNYFIHTDNRTNILLQPIFGLDALQNVEKHGGSFWIKIKS